MADGFFSLGEMIAGGGIDREGAFLEGQDIGSRIQARKATTTNALAQARLRVDEQEANEGLADAIEEMGLPREMAVHLRAGGTIKDLTGGLLQQQEQGSRATIADTTIPFEQRQAAAQSIEGKVVDPFQISGGLFADVFKPGDAPQLAPTNPFDDAADTALANQRNAAAALSDERRLNPDRFKSSTNASDSTQPLADQILTDEGISIVPDNINAEEAFGAESFIKGGVNAFTDFIGAGVQFPEQARAGTILNELSARTQIVMRADVPGSRIPLVVQTLLARYAEDPTQLFRGDELARENLRSTVAALKRSLQRVKDQVNSPTKKTPTKMGKLEDGLFALTDLVADYEKILQSIQNTEGDSDLGEAVVTPDAAGTQHEVGVSFDLPGGGTATRIE
jgi:hypothetical protein